MRPPPTVETLGLTTELTTLGVEPTPLTPSVRVVTEGRELKVAAPTVPGRAAPPVTIDLMPAPRHAGMAEE